MRVALVIVALVATALAIGLNRHHTETAASHDAASVTMPVLLGADTGAVDVDEAVAADVMAASTLGGALAICGLLVLCCVALAARAFALHRRLMPQPAPPRYPRAQTPPARVRSAAPSLTALSISRT